MSAQSTIVGFLGVAILLLAFFLNLFRCSRTDGAAYLSLNLLGAALACWSSYLIQFLPFVLLEGTWAIVAAIALAPFSITFVGLADHRTLHWIVTPAKAGVQGSDGTVALDSRFRGNDIGEIRQKL